MHRFWQFQNRVNAGATEHPAFHIDYAYKQDLPSAVAYDTNISTTEKSISICIDMFMLHSGE